MLRYVKDLTRRQVPLKRAHRRFRTVRAFAVHLSPRSLLEATSDDVRAWSGDTALDKLTLGRRRSDLRDFYAWCRGGPEAARGPLLNGTRGTASSPPEDDAAVTTVPATTTLVTARGAAPPEALPTPDAEAPSLSRRLGVVLVLSAVGILWLAAAAMPNRVAEPGRPPPSTMAAPPSTEPTTTTVPVRPPPEVSVMAVNASGVRGRAATVTETLRSASYAVVAPQSAARPQPASSVYWTPGYESEARAVATALGLPPTAARPAPGSLGAGDLKGANVVVVVGQDLAGPR